jgi:hypothetical protein
VIFSCGKIIVRSDQLAKHEVYCTGSDVSESEMYEDKMEDEREMNAV